MALLESSPPLSIALAEPVNDRLCPSGVVPAARALLQQAVSLRFQADRISGPVNPGRLLKEYSGSRTGRLCAFRQGRGHGVRRRAMVSAAPEPKAKNERRRGVAALRRGRETQDQPHNRPVPTTMSDVSLRVGGLGWHGPISVVGAPNRSYGYGVVAPPRIWGRGIPNAAHCTPSTAF